MLKMYHFSTIYYIEITLHDLSGGYSDCLWWISCKTYFCSVANCYHSDGLLGKQTLGGVASLSDTAHTGLV